MIKNTGKIFGKYMSPKTDKGDRKLLPYHDYPCLCLICYTVFDTENRNIQRSTHINKYC